LGLVEQTRPSQHPPTREAWKLSLKKIEKTTLKKIKTVLEGKTGSGFNKKLEVELSKLFFYIFERTSADIFPYSLISGSEPKRYLPVPLNGN
jgi:hypothetical protein